MKSLEIKYALLSYFRFKRQWLCATEVCLSDVLVIAGNQIIEVEVKVNKYDLWKGEAKKLKHKPPVGLPPWWLNHNPNKFYICVPEELLEEAKKWVSETNNKYGIILYVHRHKVQIIKKAQKLHNNYSLHLEESLMKRVCSENIGLIEKILEEEK